MYIDLCLYYNWPVCDKVHLNLNQTCQKRVLNYR